MGEKISVNVSLKKYNADMIRYSAYAMSGFSYVTLCPGRKGEISVTLEPKPGASAAELAGLKKRFEAELKDEKFRYELADSNRELREFIVLKALSGAATPPQSEDSGLTPEQEKELDELIAQVEREIKTEAAGRPIKDPLGITKTWEDKHASKSPKSKNKK